MAALLPLKKVNPTTSTYLEKRGILNKEIDRRWRDILNCLYFFFGGGGCERDGEVLRGFESWGQYFVALDLFVVMF